jgi:hypothetical protein
MDLKKKGTHGTHSLEHNRPALIGNGNMDRDLDGINEEKFEW